MDWDDELCVNVRIPHGEDLDDFDTDVYCWAVPGTLVECAIDTLQALLALWRDEVGNEPDDDKWGPLLAAAGYVLGGLLHVQATRDSRQGARRLVAVIAGSWVSSSMRRHLEVLRQDPETDYIAEALLTLHQEARRRHHERLREADECQRQERKQQQAAAGDATSVGRAPATDQERAWDF